MRKECGPTALQRQQEVAVDTGLYGSCNSYVSFLLQAQLPVKVNIAILYKTFFGAKPDELPSVNFVRECRVVVEVVGETITAFKLTKANQ